MGEIVAASGIITTAIQVSYAVGLTALGSLFLGRAELPVPHASGHAFMTIAMVLAGLALLGALLAALLVWQERNATVPRPLRVRRARLALRRVQ